MSTEYIGSVTLYLDAAEVEITKIDVKDSTGRKPVKTMNRQGRVMGYADGITEHKLSATAAIPIDGTEIDWGNITRAKITIYPINKEDKRVSYLDCFSTEISEQYEADNEARIDIELIALHKIVE